MPKVSSYYTNTCTGTFTTLSTILMTFTDDWKRHRWLFALSHDAYQAYAKSVLWLYEILFGIHIYSLSHFLIKYCSLLVQISTVIGHVILIFIPLRDKLSVKCLSSWLEIILAKTVVCHSKRNEEGTHGSPQNTY